MSPKQSFYQLMGVQSPIFDPDHRFVTSWLLPPTVLASLRAFCSLYCFAVIFANWGYDGAHQDSRGIGQSFSYFTNLTYWGLAFYLLFASLHTFVYTVKGYAWLDRWPRPLQALHALFYTTVITFPFLVTLVFWIVLYRAPWFPVVFTAWSNVSQHGLNSLFALLEIILPATNPPPWLHIPFLVLLLLLYTTVAYITYYNEGFYPYSFLDPKTNGSGAVAGYSLGIGVGIVIIFLCVRLFVWLRKKYTGPGKKSQRDVGLEWGTNEPHDVEMVRPEVK